MYDEEKDMNLVREDDGEREEAKESLFTKGQSKRIWNELYKVIDSSDVVIQHLKVIRVDLNLLTQDVVYEKIIRIIWQTIRRITNKILGVKGINQISDENKEKDQFGDN
ncbi:hypothetical protein pdam_00023600 [Pocillopora damicornis]|uniref:Uncharacterized protein n=1 Tax=Pocillopora damicornis TaxID=46731 RepID=A0A3M6U725_POCDA|nr:hypothetical protein pdam_00023600 [Pocillopora damicornis]